MRYYDDDWPSYVSAGERRHKAAVELQRLKKKGGALSPIVLGSGVIAATFWGKSWCRNLESYSDLSNRLGRGRSYVRSGCVVDLQIVPGMVSALVSGSSLYSVEVRVSAVSPELWSAICKDCAGAIDSLIELLQGRLSRNVMARLCVQGSGLFPRPAEIHFSCSCPDRASMCKHVAAVLYGIGARLDEKPALLFALREVDENDLIARAGKDIPIIKKMAAPERLLHSADLSQLFGIEIVQPSPKRKLRKVSGKGPGI